jgi:hypothetical protein
MPESSCLSICCYRLLFGHKQVPIVQPRLPYQWMVVAISIQHHPLQIHQFFAQASQEVRQLPILVLH